jgi:hypothetical protein
MSRSSAAVLAMVAFWAAAGRARAELTCAQPVFEAGTVRSGVPLAHRFRLVNRGPADVEVREVRPGCGCLRSELSKHVLRPGEEALLNVEINTLTQAPGPNRWRAVVHYRCTQVEHELPLDVTAAVVREVSVRPANLLVYTDAEIGHEFTLTDRRARPLAVRAVTTTSPHVRVSAAAPRRTAEGAWEWALSLRVAAACPEGRLEEMLHVYTDDTTYPDLKVPFTVVKRSRQRVPVVPAAVSLTASGFAALPARIVLLGSGDEAVVVDRVEVDHPAIGCRWAPGPGTRVTLRIRIDRAQITGPLWKGSVRVHLSRPAGEVVTIPLSCTLP